MKRTENISISGFSFKIESDAYQELYDYISDIRECFKGDASAEEIVEDIEVRIAELLTEKCRNGNAVTLQMVWEIKSRIGNPKDLMQEETGTEDSAHQDDSARENVKKRGTDKKRIYRDIQGRILGGVCSGLGAYFGIDRVFIRMLFIILFFIGFIDNDGYFLFVISAYICLWIAMPAARTVEEKCQMTGKPIDLEGFRSNKENEFAREVKEVASSPAGKTIERGGKIFLGLILLILSLAGLLACIFIPAIPDLIDYFIIDENIVWQPEIQQLIKDFLYDTTFWVLVLVMAGLFFVWLLYNGVMLTFGLNVPAWKPGLVLFIAWLLSIFAVCGYIIKSFAEVLPLVA